MEGAVKAQVQGSALRDALALVAPAAHGASTADGHPLRDMVRLEASDGHLLITGSDRDWAVSVQIEATVASEGVACVPLPALRAIAAEAKEELTLEGDAPLRVHGSPGRYRLEGAAPTALDHAALPVEPVASAANVFEDALMPLIARTVPFTGSERSHPELGGVCWRPKAWWATDTYRAIEHWHDLPVEVPEEGVVLPAGALRTVAKVLEGFLSVKVTEREATFRSDKAAVRTRLIGYQFPDIGRIFAAEREESAYLAVDANALADSCRRARLIATPSSVPPHVRLALDGGDLHLTLHDDAVGEAEVTVPLIRSEGELPDGIACNAEYLAECVQALGGSVALNFGTVHQPVLLKGDATAQVVLMPVVTHA